MTDWMDSAACRGMDPSLFVPATTRSPKKSLQAARVCVACPVADECGAHAISARERAGVWAGREIRVRDTIADHPPCVVCGAPVGPARSLLCGGECREALLANAFEGVAS